ncbi:MAG: hypothetical protein O2856_12960 [Planctomycetota bacterium]|nr:hypothetical protein [Planctomycetota bacterium]
MPDFPETSYSLIERVHNLADEASWVEFLGIYQPVVYQMARRRGLQDADAQDVIQQVFASIAKSIDGWKAGADRPLFRAETSYGVLRRITDEKPRPIREINPDIPDWLCGIVARLMAKQPEDRFASASEVAELLEKCLAHLQQPATVPLPHSVIAATPAAHRNDRPPLVKFVAAAVRFRIQPESRVSVLAWSPDASTLAVGGDRGIVSLRDGQTGKHVKTLKLLTDEELASLDAVNLGSYTEVGALAFSTDSTLLAVGNGLGQLKLFNVRSGELIRAFDDDRAKLAETENPGILKSLERGLGSVGSLALSSDGSLLATSGRSFADFTRFVDPVERRLGERSTGPGRLKVWEVMTGTLKHDLDGHSDANMVAFSADGSLLASAGRWLDKTNSGDGVIVWNPQSGEKLQVLSQEANGGTHAVAFSPDGNKVVIASRHFDNENGTSTTTVRLAYPLSGITAWQQTVEGWAKPKGFLPDGKSVVVLFAGKLIRLMDAETGAVKNESQSADFPPDSPLQAGRWIDIAISPDGTRLAIGGVASTNLSFVEVFKMSPADTEHDHVSSDPSTLDAINRELAELAETLHHDFATDGVLRDRFVVQGKDGSELTVAESDGLHY